MPNSQINMDDFQAMTQSLSSSTDHTELKNALETLPTMPTEINLHFHQTLQLDHRQRTSILELIMTHNLDKPVVEHYRTWELAENTYLINLMEAHVFW